MVYQICGPNANCILPLNARCIYSFNFPILIKNFSLIFPLNIKQTQNSTRETNELTAVKSLTSKLRDSVDRISELEKARIENQKQLTFTKLENERLLVSFV